MARQTKGLTVSSSCSQQGEQPKELFPEAQALLGQGALHFGYTQDTSRKAKEPKQETYFKGKKTLNCQENTTHVTHKKEAKKHDVKPHLQVINSPVVETKTLKFYLPPPAEAILSIPNYDLFGSSAASQTKGFLKKFPKFDKQKIQIQSQEYVKSSYRKSHDYILYPLDEKMEKRFNKNKEVYVKFWEILESWSKKTRNECRAKFQDLLMSVKNDMTLHCLQCNMYELYFCNSHLYEKVARFDQYLDDIDRVRVSLQAKRIIQKIIRKGKVYKQKQTLEVTFRGYQIKWGDEGYQICQQQLLFTVKSILDSLAMTNLTNVRVKFIHGKNFGQSQWRHVMLHLFDRLEIQPNNFKKDLFKKNKVFEVSPIRVLDYYENSGHLMVDFKNCASY